MRLRSLRSREREKNDKAISIALVSFSRYQSLQFRGFAHLLPEGRELGRADGVFAGGAPDLVLGFGRPTPALGLEVEGVVQRTDSGLPFEELRQRRALSQEPKGEETQDTVGKEVDKDIFRARDTKRFSDRVL